MGFATEREPTCPHCGEGTMQYVDTKSKKTGVFKCKRCGGKVEYEVPSYGELEVRKASLRGELIRLGSQNPSLRKHLRPVLSEIEKTANSGSLTRKVEDYLSYLGDVLGSKLPNLMDVRPSNTKVDAWGVPQLVCEFDGGSGPDSMYAEIQVRIRWSPRGEPKMGVYAYYLRGTTRVDVLDSDNALDPDDSFTSAARDILQAFNQNL